jgi:hypothetical protein
VRRHAAQYIAEQSRLGVPVAEHHVAGPTVLAPQCVPGAAKGPSVAVRQRGVGTRGAVEASYSHLPEVVQDDSSPAVYSQASVPGTATVAAAVFPSKSQLVASSIS